MELGKTIRALRARKGVTQEQAAACLGVSCQAVSKWETGASLPDITLLPAIAAYFGATIDELFQTPAETRFEQIENMMEREGHIAPEAFGQAAAFLTQATVDDPKCVRAWTDLADLYNHRAQYDHYLAAEYARRALELAPEAKPGWAAYLEAMGGVYGDEWYDNHFEVIEYFKQFLAKNPDSFQGHYALIENLMADGRHEEAVPYIHRLRVIRDDYLALFYLGDVALYRGDRDGALRLWDAGVEKSPGAWQAWCSRADRIKKLGMTEQAEADYEKSFAIQSPPRLTDPLFSLEQLHEQRGDFAAAIRDYERILDVNEHDYDGDVAESERLREAIDRLRKRLERPAAP